MADVAFTIKYATQGDKNAPKNLGKQLEGVLDAAKKTAVAVGAMGAVFKEAFELGKQGAALNQIEESFNRMNEAVFKTPSLLEDMRNAVRGTIKDTDLMRGLLTLTAGSSEDVARAMAEAAPRLLEIAKASNKLNPSLGDTAFLYDSIARGVKRQSPLILDNLGIVIKLEEAYKDYAQSVGKTVDELDANERVLATLNATLESGDQLIKQVGGNVDSQADSWAQLEVQVGQALDGVKRWLADGLTPLIRESMNLKNALDEREAAQKEAMVVDEEASRRAGHLVYKIDEQAAAERRRTAAVEDYTASQKKAQQAQEEFRRGQDHLITSAQNHAHWQELVNDRTKWYTALANDQEDSAARVEAMMTNVADATKDVTEETEEQIRQLDALNSLQNDYFFAALKAGKETSLYGIAIEDLGTKYVTVGGLSRDQREELDRIRGAYDKAQRTLRDYEIGLTGAGLSSEELAKKMQEQRDEMGRLEGAMAPYLSVTGDVIAVQNDAIFSIDAINATLFELADKYNLSAESAAALGVATGQLDPKQAQAIVRAALLNIELGNLIQAYKDGKISAEDVVEVSGRLAEKQGLTADAAIRQWEQFQHANSELGIMEEAARTAAEALENMPDEVRVRIAYDIESVPGAAGGQTIVAGGRSREGQHGLDFFVPAGFPNDSYMVGVSSGEHVNVQPQIQYNINLGGMNVNVPSGDPNMMMAMMKSQLANELRSATAAGMGIAGRST